MGNIKLLSNIDIGKLLAGIILLFLCLFLFIFGGAFVIAQENPVAGSEYFIDFNTGAGGFTLTASKIDAVRLRWNATNYIASFTQK